MSDDLEEIERLARAVEEARRVYLDTSWTDTGALRTASAALQIASEQWGAITPARVLALVARLRRAERVVEAMKAERDARLALMAWTPDSEPTCDPDDPDFLAAEEEYERAGGPSWCRVSCRGAAMIAALFVDDKDGPYVGLDGVEVWGVTRDARTYRGPWPVVAHPPCERWGRYARGGPSAKTPRVLGDDGGCFAAALDAVRSFRGVLEHPEASHAWRHFGLITPPKSGGWVAAGDGLGWTCCVEQGHYGHRARKATWLYAVGVELPSLRWGRSSGERLDEGFHSAEERRAARAAGRPPRARLTPRECWATPIAFRNVLLDMARSARRVRAA